MRDYARIAGTFWIGKTGKEIKKHGTEAVVVAMYLMSSPHSNMIGLYYQPMLYIAHETGLGIEGALKGLKGCIEAKFCGFDEASEVVWVYEMASYQIADALAEKDLRCKGIQREYDSQPECPFLPEFFDRYAAAFHMSSRREWKAETQAPLKPLASQEHEQEHEQAQEQEFIVPIGTRQQPAASDRLPACPTLEIIRLYHEALPMLPRAVATGDKRTKTIKTFWRWVLTSKKSDGTARANDADQALTWIGAYFARAASNDFIIGNTGRNGEHSKWQATIDYLCSENGRIQVIERTAVPA